MKKAILALIFILTLMASSAFAATPSRGNIVHIGQDVIVQADEVVKGNIVVINGNVTINGKVEGNVVSVLGSTKLGPEGSILGQLVSVDSGSGVRIANNTGNRSWDRSYNFGSGFDIRAGYNFLPLFWGSNLIWGMLMAFIAVALFPGAVGRIQGNLQAQPGRAILVGLLVSISVVIIGFILAITIIGIPLALLVAASYWVAKQLGYAAIALLVGSALLKGEQKLLTVVVGALLVGLITAVPIAGWMASIVLTWAAIGAVLNSRFGVQEVENRG